MDQFELLERLAAALAIGLMIGIERGWAARDEAEGERAAGLRTHALSGLLGGVSGALAILVPNGAIVLGLAFLGFAPIIAAFRYREMQRDGTYGATTVVAALLAFALGALAVVGPPAVAAAGGVATAGLLSLKAALHTWLKRLTWDELRSGLMLLAMSLVLLPVLPDKGYGPFQAINPYSLWLMSILIAVVSSAGYVALKGFDGAQGVAFSGIAGGLVSSTAVTLSFSRLAKEQPGRLDVLVAGMLLAGATMLARVLLLAGTVDAPMLRWLAPPLVLAGVATLLAAGWHLRRQNVGTLERPLSLTRPFELSTVLKFTVFLAVIMVAAKALTAWVGDVGAYVLGAVSGIADVDAVTLSLSRLAGQGSLVREVAAGAIVLTAAVNTVAKAVIAAVAGGRAAGSRMAVCGILVLSAGAVGYLVARHFDPLAAFEPVLRSV